MPVRKYCYFCAAHSNLIPDLFLRKLQSIPSFLQSTYQYFENIHYARHLTYTQTWSYLAYNPQATTDEAEYYTYLGDEFFFRIYSSGFALSKSLPVVLDDDEDDELEITNNILQPIVDPRFFAPDPTPIKLPPGVLSPESTSADSAFSEEEEHMSE